MLLPQLLYLVCLSVCEDVVTEVIVNDVRVCFSSPVCVCACLSASSDECQAYAAIETCLRD